jgi:hypothetical protein
MFYLIAQINNERIVLAKYSGEGAFGRICQAEKILKSCYPFALLNIMTSEEYWEHIANIENRNLVLGII